jgi:hypothetical protein
MGVAASLPRRVARRRARLARRAAVGAAAPLVGVLVLTSTLLRGFAGALKETPAYFQDEYLYAELSRTIADAGEPLVRGSEPHFPALLQPILTAPAWFLGDVGDSYAVVKWIGALAMSLAAVPAFLLARRLGLGQFLSLGAAALTIATPSMLYTSWVVSEPFAYPLALGAVAAGTVALADGRRGPQCAFLILAALAAFSRAQFLVLPFCYVAGIVLLGLRRRALRPTLREQALVLSLVVAPLTLALVLAPGRLLGPYESIEVDTDLTSLPALVGRNALGVAYASGWVLVPGALLGFWFAFARPRSRTELAFAAFGAPLALILLVQASLVGDVGLLQERYTFYLVPVIGLAFGLFASRGWPARRAHALVAAMAVIAAAAVPLVFDAADAGGRHSAFLFAVHRLDQLLGHAESGSLAAAGVGALLALSVAVLGRRPGMATPAAFALALGFCTAGSALAFDFDRRNSSAVRAAFLPSESSWIDEAALGDVALVRGLGLKTDAMEQLFWNRSINRVLLLPGAKPFDSFGATPISLAPDGRFLVDRRPVRSALLVDEWAARIELRGAAPVASSTGFRLWRPAGTPRLALFAPGYYRDGWLALRAGLNVWAPPRGGLEGRISFVVSAPDFLPAPVRLRVRAGEQQLEFRLRQGASRRVTLPVCEPTSWAAVIQADRGISLGNRVVSARATPPRYRPDRSACR